MHPHPPFPRHTPSTVRPAKTNALRQGLVCIERLKNNECAADSLMGQLGLHRQSDLGRQPG